MKEQQRENRPGYGSYNSYGSYAGAYGPEQGGPASFDLAALYFALRERLWLIVLCVAVMVVLGAYHILTSTKIYRATAAVEVAADTQQETVNIEDTKQEDSRTLEYLKTIEQGLVSPGLLVRVAKENNLLDNPHFFPKGGAPYTDDKIARIMTDMVSSKLRRGTRLVDLSVNYTTPEEAASVAQAVVKEYIQEGIQRKLDVVNQSNQVLMGEADDLRAKVQKSEEVLQDYMEKNNAVSLQDTQNIVVDQLKELNIEAAKAKNDRLTAESEYDQYLSLAGHPAQELLTIQTIAAAPAVLEMKKEVAEEEAEIANLSKRYRPEHPKYIQAESELAALDKSLDKVILEAADGLHTTFLAAQSTENRLQDSLKASEERALELNKLAIPYDVIQREVDSNQALYDAVLKRLKEADATKGITQENVELLEAPVVPTKPYSPKKLLILAVSTFTGLFIGCGLAYVLYALDATFKTVDETESKTGLPVIAAIPRSKKEKFDSKSLALVATPRSPLAESFRSLRTALSVRGKEGLKTVLITSAVPSEGKSFSAANYAVALAHQEHRTLLIDADLRKPRIGGAFGIDSKAPGLSDCLIHGEALTEAIHETAIENLFVMPAGSLASKPSELLGNDRVAAVLREVTEDFDRVVIDSAPINSVSDTLLLLGYADAICLVIRASSTPVRAVLRACHEIAEAGGKDVRVVLNCLPLQGGRKHHYHYFVGGYGDKDVYAENRGAVA